MPRPGGPGELEVEEAAAELNARVRRLYPGGAWPPHLTRSADFPTQPLVALLPFEDQANSGADLLALGTALEEGLRRERQLRLDADELAVPPSLREGDGGWPGPATAPAGLELRAWIDAARRVRLALVDRQSGETLVHARSSAP